MTAHRSSSSTPFQRFRRAATALVCVFAALPSYAQDVAAPYDDRLNRFAELLGSIHYLHNLCGTTDQRWRTAMNDMLATEKPEPIRRARLVASFNKGFRSFDSVYTGCTMQARSAADRYVAESRLIARDIVTRFAD